MKKGLIWALALIMALGCFAGCTTHESAIEADNASDDIQQDSDTDVPDFVVDESMGIVNDLVVENDEAPYGAMYAFDLDGLRELLEQEIGIAFEFERSELDHERADEYDSNLDYYLSNIIYQNNCQVQLQVQTIKDSGNVHSILCIITAKPNQFVIGDESEKLASDLFAVLSKSSDSDIQYDKSVNNIYIPFRASMGLPFYDNREHKISNLHRLIWHFWPCNGEVKKAKQ